MITRKVKDVRTLGSLLDELRKGNLSQAFKAFKNTKDGNLVGRSPSCCPSNLLQYVYETTNVDRTYSTYQNRKNGNSLNCWVENEANWYQIDWIAVAGNSRVHKDTSSDVLLQALWREGTIVTAGTSQYKKFLKGHHPCQPGKVETVSMIAELWR